jgi:hypothetical protein
MSEAIWAALAFLLGWKAAGGDPHAAATGAKNAVHQVVTQASNTVWSAAWSVTWHLALVAVVILALLYGGSVLLRRARKNVLGR